MRFHPQRSHFAWMAAADVSVSHAVDSDEMVT
jgi:hypothetical protein